LEELNPLCCTCELKATFWLGRGTHLVRLLGEKSVAEVGQILLHETSSALLLFFGKAPLHRERLSRALLKCRYQTGVFRVRSHAMAVAVGIYHGIHNAESVQTPQLLPLQHGHHVFNLQPQSANRSQLWGAGKCSTEEKESHANLSANAVPEELTEDLIHRRSGPRPNVAKQRG
jgi:hypothetical protein